MVSLAQPGVSRFRPRGARPVHRERLALNWLGYLYSGLGFAIGIVLFVKDRLLIKSTLPSPMPTIRIPLEMRDAT